MSLGSRRVGWFSLLLCLGMSGCTPMAEAPVDEQKNPHYRAGMDRVNALDYKGAIDSFERALDDNPRSCLAHYQLGMLYDVRENDYESALYHYKQALKLRKTGYPCDNIRQRIPACRQELAKADSLSVVNPTVLRETERLREENQELRRQLEALRGYAGTRPPPGGPTRGAGAGSSGSPGSSGLSGAATSPTGLLGGGGGGTGLARTNNTPLSRNPGGLATDRGRFPGGTPGTSSGGSPTSATTSGRTHPVKGGETVAAIARQHGLKLSNLLAANPGLDPRRLRIGQALNLP